jgi:hypothetical protein
MKNFSTKRQHYQFKEHSHTAKYPMMERILGGTKKAEKKEATKPGNSTQDVLQLRANIYEYCKISVEECHI